MRILLIGANGQLGFDLSRVFKPLYGEDFIALTHREIEITDPSSLTRALDEYRPDCVINTSAFHKLESCEDQVERTFAVNAYGVRNLAQMCAARDITLVTISTDYVFGADRGRIAPYLEADAPGPVNVYGVSKLASEYFVQTIAEKFFIVRVSGLYGVAGSSGKGGNFVELMIRLAQGGNPIRVVNDQILTPTPTLAVARQIVKLIQTEHYGLYHATCQGQCSWYEFASEIFRQTGNSPELSPQSTEEAVGKVRRPAYSVLENANLKRLGLDTLPFWKDGLSQYLLDRSKILESSFK